MQNDERRTANPFRELYKTETECFPCISIQQFSAGCAKCECVSNISLKPIEHLLFEEGQRRPLTPEMTNHFQQMMHSNDENNYKYSLNWN